MTGKGTQTDEDMKATFNEIEAIFNSEETRAAFRRMDEELKRMDLLSRLVDLDSLQNKEM